MSKRLSIVTLAACLGFWTGWSPPGHAEMKLVVYGGKSTRLNAIVHFKRPLEFKELVAVKDAWGNVLPVQVDHNNNACFQELYCQKGSTKTYEMLNYEPPTGKHLKITAAVEGSKIRLMTGKTAPVYYQLKLSPLPNKEIKRAYLRGAYFHPLQSPSGLLLSDDYPSNHLHHHGLWFAWSKTKYINVEPDFWNMGKEQGTVTFERLDKIWSGYIHAGFHVSHCFRSANKSDGPPVLNETWKVQYYCPPSHFPMYTMFDLTSEQTCATSEPLILPKYHYGGLAFRGNRKWDGAENAVFLTSEGETDRVKGNETRARWIYMGGKVKGKQTGIIILCHPDNYRSPQPLRLHPEEPYFCYAPQQLGDMAIAPGQPYVSRYRCILIDDPPRKDWIEQEYANYADPPTVKFEDL